ncbi:MAG TPA: hypothetical protein VHL09_12805 [Dehalococcoidia bacterium]|nr:hypothetical protein [Dehalococcoidia bacterium]
MATYDSDKRRSGEGATSAGGAAGKVKSYSALQSFFLLRLGRLLRLKQLYSGLSGQEEWVPKLLNKSIYSTYCDCLEQGVTDDARALIERGGAGSSDS